MITHDELLERIYQIHNDSSDGGKPITKQYSGMLKFQKALRAVVELHKPTLNHHIHPMVDYCYQCQDGTPDEPYPCPTIQAIEKELQ